MNVELQTSDPVAENTEKTALEIMTGRKKLGKIFNKRTAGYAYLPLRSRFPRTSMISQKAKSLEPFFQTPQQSGS